MSNEQIQKTDTMPNSDLGFFNPNQFEAIQRVAKCFSASKLIPTTFQNNIPDCVIALDMANRMSANPMAVMQNLYIVHGKPSWSSQFIIACINATKRYTPLRFDMTGEGDARACVCWAKDKEGERLESPPVSIAMSKAEGWYGKNGSKWQTMPELMLRYRAATLFGRLYAPEILMGMGTMEEAEDIGKTIVNVTPEKTVEAPLTVKESVQTPVIEKPKVEQPKISKAKPAEEKPIEPQSEQANKTKVQELMERMNSEGISASNVRDFAERINVKITSEDGARIVLERWEYVMKNCKA